MLRVEALEKRFGKTYALAGVTFSAGKGCIGLLGPNGAGKTTLLRCIAGLLQPSAGRVGADTSASGANTHGLEPGTFGFLPQHFDFFKELTAAEVLSYLGTLSGLRGPLLQSQVESALSNVNLIDRANCRVRSLSGGMLRRLGIAQTLLGDPSVLLYDEPTVGLDPEERARFRSLLLTLRESHCILLSTHLVEDVRELCDRVLVLERGEVRFDGSPQQLAEKARGHVVVGRHLATTESHAILSGSELIDGVPVSRWVCESSVPEASPEPTLEDGYLYVANGFGA